MPDFLEMLRKEFAVPVLLSIPAFHRCSVTAAGWKKGVALPGRDLCPAPGKEKPLLGLVGGNLPGVWG